MIKHFFIFILGATLLLSCNSEKKKIATNVKTQDFISGKLVYDDFCINCHMPDGKGVPNAFPPLANSDYLMSKREESIRSIKYGLKGPIEVNGVKYNGVMAKQGLSDKEIADVMNYITNNWNNKNEELVTENEVSKIQQ